MLSLHVFVVNECQQCIFMQYFRKIHLFVIVARNNQVIIRLINVYDSAQ
jgi:hypothetical protein